MHARLQVVLWSIAAAFGLAYSDSEAAPKTTAPAQTKSMANEQSFGHIISELHQAKHLLDHANHTYNGHRAKADQEIGKAIHILHPEHHKKRTTTKTAQKAPNEAQQASDTQLRQAEKLVHAAILGLHRHHGEKAHHASKLLHEAAHEIELAIHLHNKHHAKKA